MNNLILEVKNVDLEMYVDDSTICIAAKYVETINSTDTAHVISLYPWISVNSMVLNVNKTEFVLLCTIKRLNNALMDLSVSEIEYIITPVNTHTHKLLLGLHVDASLS